MNRRQGQHSWVFTSGQMRSSNVQWRPRGTTPDDGHLHVGGHDMMQVTGMALQSSRRKQVSCVDKNHRITISQPQRQRRDLGEILGVPRLHALKAEWRKRQVFVQDKVTEPAATGRCRHFSVSLLCCDGWYLGDSHPAATHKKPQSCPF